MRITFSSLDSIPCRSHEIALEYHIAWPRRCLTCATFKNQSNLDFQDQDYTKNVIFKIKIRSLKKCDLMLKVKIVLMSDHDDMGSLKCWGPMSLFPKSETSCCNNRTSSFFETSDVANNYHFLIKIF